MKIGDNVRLTDLGKSQIGSGILKTKKRICVESTTGVVIGIGIDHVCVHRTHQARPCAYPIEYWELNTIIDYMI
jgi:hypothetical protein